MSMSNVAQLSLIHTEIFHCTLCALHTGRTHTVPGAGDPHADLMFIGEAPGKNEDEQGLPFVGRSGAYLDELLTGIGLTRDEVFIANVVKCRPPDNRDPHSDEIDTCNAYLRRQIAVIDPLVIATLGRYSMAMFFPNEKISHIHGQARYGTRRAYVPLFHPAYILRNPSKKPEMEADFQQLLTITAEVRQKRDSGEMNAAPDADDPIASQMTTDSNDPRQMGLFD